MDIHVEGFGNNAQPVADGQCCVRCSMDKVIQATIAALAGKLS